MHEATVQEYESLREHVLRGTPVDHHGGLVVLRRHGLAAWRARRTTAVSTAPPTASSVAPSLLNDDRYAALVPVLVNMVMGPDRQVQR